MLRFGEYIIGFWAFIIVMWLAVIAGSIIGVLGSLIKKTLLWRTPIGRRLTKGSNEECPWWLRTEVVTYIFAIIGVTTTIYALIGPYMRFMNWIK